MVALTMAEHNNIGKWGEDVAANLLIQKGLSIVERNWRTGHLEVDIIATDNDTIAFVEVKTRSSLFGNKLPEEYVDKEKERNICRAAQIYVKLKHITKNIRFDIVSILAHPITKEISRLEHIPNAFYPPLRTISNHSYTGEHRWHPKRKRIGF